ncbi:MAG: glutamine--tRNA ligase, partial [Hydrogenophaga sp.]
MSSNTPSSPSKNNAAAPADEGEHKVSNFLRQIIEKDLETGTYAQRKWGGGPGDGDFHEAGQPDPAKIRTR